ncbi:MAG: 4Fe-4S binding protein [Anaerolineaceae bacterium]|nr:4Fe-4S binding protein [Anaerolineaceae bacterium]
MTKSKGLIFEMFGALFSKPETVTYPYTPVELREGFRGALVIDADACTGCGLCVRDCPANGLALIRESREVYQLLHYPARCAYCGQCQVTCPRGAISHSNEMVASTDEPEGLVVVLKTEGAAEG